MTTYTDIVLHDTSNNYFIPYGLINRLGDVNISNPTTGQNLTFDGTTGKWKNTSTTATVAWGGITGTLSDQTDLQTVLNGKQSTLVSGINIKTINNTSIVGGGNIDTSELFIAEYGSTTYNQILTAYNAGKEIICRDSGVFFILSGINLNNNVFAFSNNTSTQHILKTIKNNVWTTSVTNVAKSDLSNVSSISSSSAVYTALGNKQDTLVSGTNIKTINNTSLLGNGNISVLQNGSAGTNSLAILGSVPSGTSRAVAIGVNETYASGNYSIAIGDFAQAAGDGSIQLGYGLNTSPYTFSVGFGSNLNFSNYRLLDGTTGLIPDARISSNIARTSAIPTIPTNISSFTNDSGYITGINSTDVTTALGYTPADTTLSNVSSIDSNSAVQTALDGKVSKSGDTMTGNLTITDNSNITLRNANVTKGTTPSTQTWQGIGFFDSTTDTYWANARLGVIECSVDTNGTVHTSVRANKNEVGSTSQAYLDLAINSSGVASCTFPNTTCVDGQWEVHHAEIAASGTSLYNSSGTNLPKTVSVPNDGHIYEIMVRCKVTTEATNGALAALYVWTNQITYTSGYVPAVCTARARSAATVEGSSTIIVPIKYGSNNFTINRDKSYKGSCAIELIAYRRLGTNS